MKFKANRVRTEWLQHTIRELSGVSKTNHLIQEEIAELGRTNRSQSARSSWINEHVLVFANGEVLFYSQRHGGGWFWGHVLLARDQNGRWFYSPYHFCHRTTMISGDQQPASMEEFSKRYSLREFDGTVADLARIQALTPPAVSYSPENEALTENLPK